jgi:hypothetical protein
MRYEIKVYDDAKGGSGYKFQDPDIEADTAMAALNTLGIEELYGKQYDLRDWKKEEGADGCAVATHPDHPNLCVAADPVCSECGADTLGNPCCPECGAKL